MPTQNSLVIINMEPQPSDPSSIPRGKQFSVLLWSLLTTPSEGMILLNYTTSRKEWGKDGGKEGESMF